MFDRRNSNSKFSVNDQILFCIYSVSQEHEKCTFDRLVKECFTRFPESLRFERYPIWPDSRKLDRPLRQLRKDALIIGDPKSYFVLTKAGEKYAEQVAKIARQGKLL